MEFRRSWAAEPVGLAVIYSSLPVQRLVGIVDVDGAVVASPTPEQMQAITATVYRDIVAAGNWAAHFDPELPQAVAEELAESVPRDLARFLRSALGAAALAGRSTIRVADLPMQQRSVRRRIGFA